MTGNASLWTCLNVSVICARDTRRILKSLFFFFFLTLQLKWWWPLPFIKIILMAHAAGEQLLCLLARQSDLACWEPEAGVLRLARIDCSQSPEFRWVVADELWPSSFTQSAGGRGRGVSTLRASWYTAFRREECSWFSAPFGHSRGCTDNLSGDHFFYHFKFYANILLNSVMVMCVFVEGYVKNNYFYAGTDRGICFV